MLMGIVLDGVAEVVNLQAGDIEDTPDFGQREATPFLLGAVASLREEYRRTILWNRPKKIALTCTTLVVLTMFLGGIAIYEIRRPPRSRPWWTR